MPTITILHYITSQTFHDMEKQAATNADRGNTLNRQNQTNVSVVIGWPMPVQCELALNCFLDHGTADNLLLVQCGQFAHSHHQLVVNMIHHLNQLGLANNHK